MTLTQWCDETKTGVQFPWKNTQPSDQTAVISDRIEGDLRWDLFHLEDYFVSSVEAGTIFLCPRTRTQRDTG